MIIKLHKDYSRLLLKAEDNVKLYNTFERYLRPDIMIAIKKPEDPGDTLHVPADKELMFKEADSRTAADKTNAMQCRRQWKWKNKKPAFQLHIKSILETNLENALSYSTYIK